MAVIVEVLGAERDGSAAIQIDDLHRGRGRVACRRPLSRYGRGSRNRASCVAAIPKGCFGIFWVKKHTAFDFFVELPLCVSSLSCVSCVYVVLLNLRKLMFFINL